MRVRLLASVRHDGARHAAGDVVELRNGADLVALGLAQPLAAKRPGRTKEKCDTSQKKTPEKTNNQ